MRKHTFFIILVIGIALAIGMWREHHGDAISSAQQFSQDSLRAGTAFPYPQKLPEFNLIDMHGNPFTSLHLKKHWSFVFFGYSTCPHVCPTTLNHMHDIARHVRLPTLQFVLVSINPEQDTPDVLKTYFQQEKFSVANFMGVTGEKAEIQRLATAIGVHAQEQGVQEHIEHSGALLLVNPEGKLAAIFTAPSKTQAIAQDFRQLAHRYANANG